MAKAKRRRAKRRVLREPRPGQPDLNAASRAQLGRDPERRAYRPLPYDASVEDPLRDWPEEG
ncbi:MAG: hypothetical protein A3G81_16005 [Betaproteobacteria bacterium RIFCSPLOWO2_12_FULL_65_14]|nr:MAG: hypothetical protein A3G81_16005 [Betaproteobacteria bacterium RIFCSPLOWO2_12_FULL_65_14]